MINLVIRYRIITNINSPTFVAGNYIEVNWDDAVNAFVVYKYDDFTLTSPTTITTGPDLGADRVDFDAVTSSRPIPYSFCSGSDLQTFTRSTLFPYSNKVSTPNHFSCVGSVCDLAFNDDYRITAASDTATDDGAISVQATSSNEPIRYSLNPDFDYNANEGQSDGNFLNLYAGEYTITAKDALGCVAQITLTVGIPEIYGVRYRLQYKDHYHRPTQTDIEERGYEGEIEYVEGDADPVVFRYNRDGELNKFDPIVPSELRLTLMCLENFKFRHLFSQDERKFKIKHYCDYGNIVPATDEIEGDTVPINLDGLANWSQFKILATYPNWAAGSTRTVTFTPITFPVLSPRPFSATLYTDYNFIEGYEYDFSIHFEATEVNNTIHLRIVDEFGVVQFSTSKAFTPGTDSININFTANASCKRVQVYVANSKTAESTVELTNITGTVTSPTIPAVPAHPAGLELEWQGYVISQNYLEAYIAPPYPVTVVATDGLADLKNYDFADYLDNLYTQDITPLKAITDILQRTDLQANFVSGINKYEVNMDNGEEDDPLNQCKFDPKTFYYDNKISKAWDALSHILKSFGARLLMRKGKFFAYIVEQSADEIPYREFTDRGVYVGHGTYNDNRDLNFPLIQSGAHFRNRDQTLEIVPTFGRFYFEHTLLKTPSLVGSYSFEAEDLYESTDGTKLIKNWNVNISNQPGAVYGIKETKAFEGLYNFFFRNTTSSYAPASTTDWYFISLLSAPFDIEFFNEDVFEFRFSYAVILRIARSWSLTDAPPIYRVYVTGTSGTGNINIGGTNYLMTFNTNALTTVEDFVSAHGATLAALGIQVDTAGFSTQGMLIFQDVPITQSVAYTNLTGDLAALIPSADNGVSNSVNPLWVKIKWSLKIGDYYFSTRYNGWINDETYKYNDLYVDAFNDSSEFKIIAPFQLVDEVTTEQAQVEFVLCTDRTIDFYSETLSTVPELKALGTINRNVGDKVKGKVLHSTPRGGEIKTLYYRITDDDDAADNEETAFLEVVEPNDYNELTNNKKWVLDGYTSREAAVEYVYIDNVVLKHYPNQAEPPSNITLEKVNNRNIKVDWDEQYLLNDIDIENINNSERTYINFYKLLDGTPTQTWERSYRTGQGKLLELLQGEVVSQYQSPGNKLTGSLLCKDEILPTTVLREVNDGNTKYMFMGYELHVKSSTVVFDMLQIKDVVTDDESPDVDADFSTDFSLDFYA